MSIFMGLEDDLKDLFQKLIEVVIGKNHRLKGRFEKRRKFVSPQNKGFGIGQYYVSQKDSYRHLMGVGNSGSGKTSSLVINTLTNSHEVCSFLINDNSGEILEIVGPFLRSQGIRVKVIDITAETFTTDSGFFNPLYYIRSRSDSAKIATMLASKASGKTDFWKLKSIELITLCINVVLTLEPRFRNLSNVLYLLQLISMKKEEIDLLMAKQSEEDYRVYASFTSNSDDTRASIVSSAISALSWLQNNPALQKLTSKDSGVLENLREPTAVFIKTPIVDTEIYSVLVSLVYEMAFSNILSREVPPADTRGIFFIIDELASLQKIPSLINAFVNIRKFSCGIFGLIQTRDGLLNHYSRSEVNTIMTNCSKVYFSGLSREEAESVSKTLGHYSYKEKDSNVTKSRPVLTTDEVQFLDPKRVILVPNSHGVRPIHLPLKPYYKQASILRKLEVEPEEEAPTEITVEIEYFPLPELPK